MVPPFPPFLRVRVVSRVRVDRQPDQMGDDRFCPLNVKLKAFPMVLKDEAKTWFQGLPMAKKGDWDIFKETLLAKYVNESSLERL